jgi:hypothetical protein
MSEMKTIAEVRNDYRDDDTGKYTIDVYLTEDDDENGFVAAEVDADGNVEWRPNIFPSLYGVYDITPIEEAIKEAQEKQAEIKQELIDRCLSEFKNDVASGDVTAIDELLKFVPSKNLQAYLPE